MDKLPYIGLALVVAFAAYSIVRVTTVNKQRHNYDTCLQVGGSVDQCIHIFYPEEEAERNQIRQLLNKDH